MPKVPANAKELLDQLADAVQKNPTKAQAIDASFGFRITGEGGAYYLFRLLSKSPIVVDAVAPTYEYGSSTCVLEISHADLREILGQPQKALEFYFAGRLRLAGDPQYAAKLSDLFGLLV